jgi:hypothetical protein
VRELPNLDPWTYHTERRHEEFSNFVNQLGVTCSKPDRRKPVAHISVDADKFWDYVIHHQDSCQQKWFHPRDFLPEKTNYEMRLPTTVGRHQGNTMEYNWGLYGNTNEEIKQLIGIENLKNAGFFPETVLARLIVYMPGHGVPWHRDSLDGWNEKFAHLNPKVDSRSCDLGTVQRRLLMVSDWHWGHVLQLNNSVLTHWSSGDVYNIPLGEWHLSANQGIMPKITISLTGVIKV